MHFCRSGWLWPRLLLFLMTAGSALSAWGNVAPEFSDPGALPPLRRGGNTLPLDLRTLFHDPDVTGTAVRISVRIGTVTKAIDLALFDQEKPITVTNFLAYVNAGRTAANFIHRSVPGFVIQGGGFAWNANGGVDAVPTFPAIQNEPGISNLRGTVAMAKLGNDPNSATSQWFINLADNSANLDAQNGGFTVFARVLGSGMDVADEVAALPRYNAGSPFDTIPLKDLTGNTILRVHTVETSIAIIPALTFTATSSDPDLLSVAVVDGTLKLTPSTTRAGSASVTVHATDLDGAVTDASLPVVVQSASIGWHVSGDGLTLSFNPGDATPVAAEPVPETLGDVALGSETTRTITIQNESSVTFPAFTVQAFGAAEFSVTSGATQPALAPGASTSFTVKFVPSTLGLRSTILTIATANPDDPSLMLGFSATGVDRTKPQFSALAPQTLAAGAERTATMPDLRGSAVTATDNVAVTDFTQEPAPGTVLSIGTHDLTFTASDAAGNTNTVSSSVTVHYDAAVLPKLTVTSAYAGASVPTVGSENLPPGSALSAFFTPAISDQRDIAARVTIAAGVKKLAAIYREDSAGSGELLAVQGQSAGGGATFKTFRDPVLAPGGAIAFAATLAGPKITEDEAVWTDVFGSLTPVLRESAALPGFPDLKVKTVTSLSLQDDSIIALVKLVRVTRVITAANDTAIVRLTGPNTATLLAQTGTGFDNSTITQISFLQPATTSPGQGRWNGAAGAIAKLILLDRRTVIVRLADNDTPAPLLQAFLPDPHFPTKLAKLGLPAMGGHAVAVCATKAPQPGVTAANDSALLVATDGVTFAEAASEAAGAGKFSLLSDPVANDQGMVLFAGTQRATGPRLPVTAGLWRFDGSGPAAILAQAGTTACDAAGQLLTDTKWKSFTSFALPDGPGAGPLFVAQLTGKAVNVAAKTGLWAVDSNKKMRLILRTNTDVLLPRGFRKLTGFTLLNALPGSFGARRSYNSTGAVAVLATFADRSQAILRIDIP